MNVGVAFICGLMMSVGLLVSGMANPAKVLGFLDVAGAFDPTLAFVMMGALVVTTFGYRWAQRAQKPVCADGFSFPGKTKPDAPLVIGAVLFGIGWGLAGFCPGPALVGVGLGQSKAALFVLAMLVGMFLGRKVFNK